MVLFMKDIEFASPKTSIFLNIYSFRTNNTAHRESASFILVESRFQMFKQKLKR